MTIIKVTFTVSKIAAPLLFLILFLLFALKFTFKINPPIKSGTNIVLQNPKSEYPILPQSRIRVFLTYFI